ncbi:T9SS type B sorting domain-containing protein [Maribacter sp. MJ134]|uniref:T9SS type B sorting domain-containing protein n=1 Tax=Maribacter sp. MJ134 TaxID=2496865 RepID=UPI000F848765|nr:T9SS type B sorting domain-containing protein [Maribacter sp. MJ134]AZQ58143.1 T9SS type B sorting domain-containing protein [Maribacter sp. MJ134]
MRLQYVLPLFFLLIATHINAQKEAAIWYFGENAGLDFNSGTPVALTDGQINTREGCATISDTNGNLLFYTDGVTVWNRNHLIMPNGTDLKGDISSTQSAIIVPKSDEPNVFFLFTVDEAGGPNGLQYSVVDMNLDGGMGDITAQKEIPLISPVSEKVTAVAHANGQGVWVITRSYGGNSYYSFLVDASGVNTVPVVTNIGPSLPLGEYTTLGYMKTSPDGKFLVSLTDNDAQVDLMRFNAATGTLSDHISLKGFFDANRIAAGNRPYGGEFSPNGKVLYIATRYNLSQFDLSTYDQNTIIASGLVLKSREFYYKGALQMGIDGKIYEAIRYYGYLNAINNPNVLGVGCDYQVDAVSLGPSGKGILGLPPFISSFFYVGIEAENLCLGDTTEFKIDVSEPITAISWDFGDGNTSTTENPSHTYSSAGDYTVSVTVTTASDSTMETKDITISEIPVATILGDITGCIIQNTYNIDLYSFNSSVLDTQDPANFSVNYFLSQTDADTNMNPLENTHSFPMGTTPVYIRVSNKNNIDCYTTTQFNIIARQSPVIDTVSDWTVCDDDTDGVYTFDLSQKNNEIFNGQDETIFELLYFASQTDADAGTNALPFSYTNTTAMEEIFFRFQNSTYPTCYRTGSFMVAVNAGVLANTPNDMEVCDTDNDGFFTFQLSNTETEIVGTQNAASLSISYHNSLADAESNTAPLPDSFTNTTAYGQTIYARVQNVSDPTCYETTSFELIVNDTPIIQEVTGWTVCDTDNNGSYSFIFNEKDQEILGGQNPSDFSLRYFETQTDADLSQNEITGPYENTSNPQTVFYRLENVSSTVCYVTESFDIEVFDTPFALSPAPIVLCDTNDNGLQMIDLTQKNIEILGTQDEADFNVRYFTDRSDAENNTNAINATSYANTQTQETLYARVERIGLEYCSAITSLELIINPLPRPVLEERYVICPDSPTLLIDGGAFDSWSWKNSDGIEISDLREFNVEELGEYELTVTQNLNGITCENSIRFEVLSSGAPETMTVETNGFSDQIEVRVSVTGTGPFEYSVDGEIFQSSNTFIVFPGMYTVFVRDMLECRTLSQEIVAMGYQKFFSPNGDGVHDNWNIIGAGLFPNAQLYIYDRYGKLLKQLSPQGLGWDGTYSGQLMPSSDYWFRFLYDEEKVYSGHFTLKR